MWSFPSLRQSCGMRLPTTKLKRFLHLHEYQSKELMRSFGINTQQFVVVDSEKDAKLKAMQLDGSEYVIKAQVLAGGRGKGIFSSGLKGGVQLTRKLEDIESLVDLMIGHRLITHQTGVEGTMVRKVMVAEAKDLAMETYFAIVLDRKTGGPIMIGTSRGGMDIESVAAVTPELIHKESIDIISGPTSEQLSRMADNLGLSQSMSIKEQASHQMSLLYKLFSSVDATQVEINPFGLTPDGEILCFDAKIDFDDNAAYRQPFIFGQVDNSETSQRELMAQQQNLNYIGMDGNIGCMVNGAGLAMATMDILKLHGGEPANFLDVGGGAQPEQIAAAYKLLLSDREIKSIFVNIFGGIVKCDLIAEGILRATREKNSRSVPLIIRLAGTNERVAKKRLMDEYPDRIEIMDDFDMAAQSAIRHATAESLLVQ